MFWPLTCPAPIVGHLNIIGENQQSIKISYKITTVFTRFNHEIKMSPCTLGKVVFLHINCQEITKETVHHK